MASISVYVDGTVRVCNMTADNPCLSIKLSKDIEGSSNIPIARDTLYLHGSIEDMRNFVQAILEALPIEVAELPTKAPEVPDYLCPLLEDEDEEDTRNALNAIAREGWVSTEESC